MYGLSGQRLVTIVILVVILPHSPPPFKGALGIEVKTGETGASSLDAGVKVRVVGNVAYLDAWKDGSKLSLDR